MRSPRFLVCAGLLCCASQLIAASPEDTAILKTSLKTTEEWIANPKQKSIGPSPGLGEKVSAQLKALHDPALQKQALQLAVELNQAAVDRIAMQPVTESVASYKGTVRFENGGPQWLRDIVGDESMHAFDRLTGIDINDRQSPHDKTYKRNDNITDDWLTLLKFTPDLTTLDIANTGIKGPGLKEVGKLKNLETLNLTLTPVTDEFLESLQDLTKLRVLSLASAQCNGESFRFFGKLKQLENANFHFTPVNDAGLAGISHVPSLTRLEIVHTHFTDAGAPALAKLVNLERLQIGSREATGAALIPLRAMKKLRELDLHDGQATVEGLKNVTGLPSLTVLRVYGPIKDEGAEVISQMKNLETLIVPGTGITDAGLKHFAALTHLKKLEIKGCKVSAEGVTELVKAVPGLEVVQ